MDAAVDAADAPAITCLDRWRAGTVTLSAPVRLDSLDSTDVDRDPFVSGNELTIYFSSERAGGGEAHIYAATRPNTNAAFGAPVERTDLSSDTYDSRFTMTLSEQIGVVASRRDGAIGGSSDLWLAMRAAPMFSFAMPTAITTAPLNTPMDELDPELSHNGLRLYFARGIPARVHVAARSSIEEPFAASTVVTELGSVANLGDADPSVSSDERVLLFSSQRDGGKFDIWYARRSRIDQPFGDVQKVPVVSSAAEDADPALSADGCNLYFASNRTAGDWEIFVSRVEM